MNNTNTKSLNYAQFQQFVYELLDKKEIELVKDWSIGRVLYKDSSMQKLESLNFVQIRSRWTKKYNILVGKQDFENVLEGVAEEITPKPDNLDEWSIEVYDYLETNKVEKIKLKELASKIFGLSSKELNMKTQHRLGSILRTLGYSKNSKTKEWSKVKIGDTEDTALLKPIASNTLEGISSVSPITNREDTRDTEISLLEQELEEANKTIEDLKAQLEEYKAKEFSRFVPENRFSYSSN